MRIVSTKTLSMYSAFFPVLSAKSGDHTMALRIDVNLEPAEFEQELELIYRRLTRPGDALYGLLELEIGLPGFIVRYREADGEHYIYVEDIRRRCLAGYTVFNRLVELNRRADRLLRAPHSKYAPRYQRRGITTTIYKWWLDRHHCLISGARQSVAANALWQSLSKHYDLVYVELDRRIIHRLGRQPSPVVQQRLSTRLILVSRTYGVERLAEGCGYALEQDEHDMPSSQQSRRSYGALLRLHAGRILNKYGSG
ncbi:N-acetyltransferase [Herbaspirillum sp. GCM10030257]|uniref:N-acetyltransferase n=1 Tax=Herbaspirillum sp. GCM10030257 TaxID=3273393 RepID=UPI00360F52D8